MILIIDGNNLAYRTFHTPQGSLTTKQGEPSGVIFGTLLSLKALIEKFPETSMVVCTWDGGKAKWRKELYPEYKANRTYGDDPEEKAKFEGLFNQIDTLHGFLHNVSVHTLKFKGWEADDLIAALCDLLPADEDKLIVTSDKDMLQLVSNKVSVYSPYKNKVIGVSNFYDETGVTLKSYMGYRAIVGDTSDNINGIDGIGEKTAKVLMDTWGHIDNILQATGKDKDKLMKSKRTQRIFTPEGLATLGRNHKIMNLRYVDYSEITDDITKEISTELKVDSKATKAFFTRWQFAEMLVYFTTFILPFSGLGEE